MYPSFAAQLDSQLGQSLAQVPDGEQKTKGIRIGQDVAARILDLRAEDGSAAPPIAYLFAKLPGDYQSTPPNFPAQPQFTHWSHVKPFALERASQFRPGPPPALTSHAYGDALNEIKSLGSVTGSTATGDQALTGRFWIGAIQDYWNEIAQTASLADRLTTPQNARLFALLSFAVISAAAAAVLADVLGMEAFKFTITSEVLPGVERSFESFAGAARKATLSRIFAGQRFRFDLDAGQRLGRQVADAVTEGFLSASQGDEHDHRAR